MLGKIHEQQGDTAKAIEHYEKFLSLWKDADPGIAELGDARERLAGLKSQQSTSIQFDTTLYSLISFCRPGSGECKCQ